MSDAERLAAARVQEQLAAVLHGLALRSPDPGVRLSMARHIAGQHPELGLDPQAISLADVTDRGLAEHFAGAKALRAQLARPGPITSSPGGDRPPEQTQRAARSPADIAADGAVRFIGVAR